MGVSGEAFSFGEEGGGAGKEGMVGDGCVNSLLGTGRSEGVVAASGRAARPRAGTQV